jgi:hypothetical protein
MEGVSSNILTSLTNGSGIDIQKLARDSRQKRLKFQLLQSSSLISNN